MGNISELERRISIRIILEDAEIIFALLLRPSCFVQK